MGLRDQLRVHQVFAERHYWERLRSPGLVLPAVTPVCDDPVPNPPALSELHCPDYRAGRLVSSGARR